MFGETYNGIWVAVHGDGDVEIEVAGDEGCDYIRREDARQFFLNCLEAIKVYEEDRDGIW